MSDGDPYDAGKNLLEFYRPVQREDKIGSVSFASRFWQDGSPRLTAYEYQGMTRSKCFRAGKPGQRITCISCHEMHGGDPRGQLTEKMKTNAACTQCHQQFATPVQLVEHTKHSAESSGSLCYNCHMPSIVYGVMSAHRTHDITIPRPDETVRFDKPNACNQCHLDWSVNRAIAASQRLWPNAFIDSKTGDKRFDEPEGQRALFAGDAVMRGLTAAAMTPANDVSGAFAAGSDAGSISDCALFRRKRARSRVSGHAQAGLSGQPGEAQCYSPRLVFAIHAGAITCRKRSSRAPQCQPRGSRRRSWRVGNNR